MSRPTMNVQASEAYRQLIMQETNRKKIWMEKYGREEAARERKKLIQTLEREAERKKNSETLRDDPIRKLLYDGVSKEGKGRAAYLKEQRKQSPVKRYQRPVTSSHEIGWLLDPENEYSKKYHMDAVELFQRGKTATITESFVQK